jgi:uncharacterized protein (DUF488 family)
LASIYTIGYGNRSLSDFLALLERYHIRYLLDVRTSPHAKYNDDFSKAPLDAALKMRDMRYVFMGDALGGRPKDPDCYTADGHVDYDRVRAAAFYQAGIARLRTAYGQGHRVALMCSELKPHQCHRVKLIGETLHALDIPVEHIDEHGELKPHADVMRLLLSKEEQAGQLTLFDDVKPTLTSRKRYISADEGENDDSDA